MKRERNHPDPALLVEAIGSGRVASEVHDHLLDCIACMRAMCELLQIAAVMFEEQPRRDTSAQLRARTLAAAAGLRPPKSTRAHGRAASAARAGSG